MPAKDLLEARGGACATVSTAPTARRGVPAVTVVQDPPTRLPPVIHLVGRVTDEVFSFLGPAMAALAGEGVAQTLIMVDDPHYRHQLPHLHASVRLVLLPVDGTLRVMSRSISALRQCLLQAPGAIVHLHGVVPSLLGFYLTRIRGTQVGALYFSPHGSRSLGSLGGPGTALLRLLRPLSGPFSQQAVASVGADAMRLQKITHESVELVESPVDPTFFEVERRPARRPLIVTGQRAHSPRSAAFFAQLAVLMGEESLQVAFNWIGTADDESLARLAAANVHVQDETDPTERAQRLAAGWIFVAPGGTLGFPVYLAEAMSVGLPCVAWDSPYHRDVLRDGKTGYLCASEAQMLERIAQLLDSAELRLRLGLAAREEAQTRFDGQRFRDSMLAVYRVKRPSPFHSRY